MHGGVVQLSDGLVKGFIISNEAWYCQLPETHLPEDELLIANFSDYGYSCSLGEVMLTWDKGIPVINEFEDTKAAMKEIPEAIPLIKDIMDREITIHEVADALLDIGYEDLTHRVKQF